MVATPRALDIEPTYILTPGCQPCYLFLGLLSGRKGSKPGPMKTNAVVLIVSASVGAALVGVGACSSMKGNKPKKVVIEDAGIFIPGTAVSKADQDSVLAVLRHYKRSLYKIQAYKNGDPAGRPHGTLPDEEIRLATVAQVASDAKQNALSGWGIQIGYASHPSVHPTPTPSSQTGSASHPSAQTTPTPSSTPSRTPLEATPAGSPSHPSIIPPPDFDQARELISKIAPILRKYSQ